MSIMEMKCTVIQVVITLSGLEDSIVCARNFKQFYFLQLFRRNRSIHNSSNVTKTREKWHEALPWPRE